METDNTHYEVMKFKAINLSKMTRMVKIPQKRLSTILLNLEEMPSIEEAKAIIEGRLPVEPFIIGTDRWEQIMLEKTEEISSTSREMDILIAESLKEKTKNFKFELNKEAYRKFLGYRIDFHNKKVSQAGAEKQKGKLRKYPIEIQEEMVKKAIEKRWESIFEPSKYELDMMQNTILEKKEAETFHIDENSTKARGSSIKNKNDEEYHISYEDMITNFE